MSHESGKNNIDPQTVRYVAWLSRIELDDREISRFGEQLTKIIGHIAELKEVDTENIPPTTHVLPSMKNVFREDVLKPSISTDDALLNAPSRKGNFFKVPKIIEDV